MQFSLDKTLSEFINKLENNSFNIHFKGHKVSQMEYFRSLKVVMEVIAQKKDANLEELKNIMYDRSNINEIIDQIVNKEKITPGIAVAYGNKNYQEIIYAGKREELENKNGNIKQVDRNMKYDSLFDLDQVSSIFTDIIILKLIRDNVIRITEPASHFDNRFVNLRNVSLYDLLTNSRVIMNNHISNNSTTNDIESSIYNGIVTKNYNVNKQVDISPIVLRNIAQRVTGCSLNDLIRYYIINPLNLRETFTNFNNVDSDKIVSNKFEGVYSKDGYYELDNNYNFYDPIANVMGDNLIGHSGLFSSALNMATLGQNLINNIQFSNLDILGYHEFNSNNSLYHALSGKSNKVSSRVGTVFSYNPDENIFVFIGSNKVHNRVSYVNKKYENQIKIDASGIRTIETPNQEIKIVSDTYAENQKKLISEIYKLVTQYNFIDEVYDNKEINRYNVRMRKL